MGHAHYTEIYGICTQLNVNQANISNIIKNFLFTFFFDYVKKSVLNNRIDENNFDIFVLLRLTITIYYIVSINFDYFSNIK